MITDERIASFINSFNNDYDDAITAIRKEAEEQGVPIIRREAGEFIRLLLRMKKPVNILEIGTAVGFSAIFMSRFIAEGGHITTIENYQPRIDRAKENIKLAGAEKKITLLEGDAMRSCRHCRINMIWSLWMLQKVSMEAFSRRWFLCLHRKESCYVIMCCRMEMYWNRGLQ